VTRTIAQLQHESLQAMAADITRRRLAWLDRTLPDRPGYEAYSPREVYELLFFVQMGLPRAELPVVAESPDEVVWLSRNRCPLLEACEALQLDTRRICRAVNEKATQAFLSRLNPELRFHRSYEQIRPYATHCREWIRRLDFRAYLRLAVEEAGDDGCGAVVVYDGRVVGRGCSAVAAPDPQQHAEAQAIHQAVTARGDSDLCGAVLFSSREPCAACLSLAQQANLTSIVYLASSQEGERGRSDAISARRALGRPPGMEVIGVYLMPRNR
jgi:tRNA(Arg) A34 adenosine deaminase TadA